jgi:hypothetical protein
VAAVQLNFTVLVNVTDPGLKTVDQVGGHVRRADGFDIGFYTDAALTTKLKWQIEKYDNVAGTLVAWVKLPTLSSSTDTVFYMGYGDETIVTAQ